MSAFSEMRLEAPCFAAEAETVSGAPPYHFGMVRDATENADTARIAFSTLGPNQRIQGREDVAP
jgi:hypothetical protein